MSQVPSPKSQEVNAEHSRKSFFVSLLLAVGTFSTAEAAEAQVKAMSPEEFQASLRQIVLNNGIEQIFEIVSQADLLHAVEPERNKELGAPMGCWRAS